MKALLLVDIQNDFLPGGALEVPEGDQIVDVVNELLEKEWDLIVATKDWHPEDHKSFAANHSGKEVGEIIDLEGVEQILWPVHCVQDTFGAEFHEKLNAEKIEKIFYKGTDSEIDSYSAFFDNAKKKATGLFEFLKEKKITDLYIVGLATDYCVLYSVLDAQELGFQVYLVQDGCRGIDLNPGDIERAAGEMKKAGAQVVDSLSV